MNAKEDNTPLKAFLSLHLLKQHKILLEVNATFAMPYKSWTSSSLIPPDFYICFCILYSGEHSWNSAINAFSPRPKWFHVVAFFPAEEEKMLNIPGFCFKSCWVFVVDNISEGHILLWEEHFSHFNSPIIDIHAVLWVMTRTILIMNGS